jgi:RNA polymerase sigma-70 factor (ECF subfamily)
MAEPAVPLSLEGQLAERAQGGDSHAFAELVTRYQRPIRAACMRYLRSSEADDTAQETFVRAFVHIGDFDPQRPMLPWLITIARRLCLDRLRRRKHEADDTAVELARSTETSAEDAASQREQLHHLQTAMAKLAEGPREALALFHFDELSYQEIATAMEVPIGTVMTWIHRGREELRAHLREVNR